jgi:uncharacterized membrane protein
MFLLLLALIIFIGWHLVPSICPSISASMQARFGKGAWHAVFGIVSLLSLAFLVYGFGEARAETGILYEPPVGMAHLTVLLMLFAMILVASAVLPAGHIASKSKFPLLVAVKLWALSHLLANGEASSVLLFVSFLAWAVIVRIIRKRRASAGLMAMKPFVSARYDIFAVVIGALLWLAIIFKLHVLLIGVPVLTM